MNKTKQKRLPTRCNGTQLAAILTKRFDRLVTPASITRAVRDEGMVGKQLDGSWKVSDAIEWWAAHRANQSEDYAALQAESNLAVMRKQISDSKRSQLETEKCAKENSGKWIETEMVTAYIAGIGSRIALVYDQQIEDRDGLRKIISDELAEHGLDKDLISLIDSRLSVKFQAANDRIKSEFKVIADESAKRVEKARREQLKKYAK